MRVVEKRVGALAAALSREGLGVYRRADEHEPEYRLFSRIASRYVAPDPLASSPPLTLIAILCGIIDYQENAQRFWARVERELEADGFPQDLRPIEATLLRIAAGGGRAAASKVLRLNKASRRGFASWYWTEGWRAAYAAPTDVWRRLADVMGDPPDKKTVLMAMKCLDMTSLAVRGQYLPLHELPIIVDVRIVQSSLRSGLLALEDDERGMAEDELAQTGRSTVIEAWRRVVLAARAHMGDEFSAFRLDSLLWQTAQAEDRDVIAGRLEEYGFGSASATALAAELTAATSPTKA